jgi:tetratricopeptide (TPR) repeat protein
MKGTLPDIQLVRILFVLLSGALSLAAVDLPDLPKVETVHFLPVIRSQIDAAVNQAKAHPLNGQIVGALAMTLHAYQQYEPAERTYLRAGALEPQNADWLYLLGNVQMSRGLFEKAANSLRSALRIRAEDLPAQLRLAECLGLLGKWTEGMDLYRSIKAKHDASPQAWYGLGRAQAGIGDHAGAQQSFQKACELFPAYGAAHFALARELRRVGLAKEAGEQMAAYSTSANREPPLDDPLLQRIHELNRSTSAHLQRSMEFERTGRFNEAVREHEAAITQDPDNIQLHINLISLYGRMGDSAKAKQQFAAATKLNPNRSDAWYNYGVLLFAGQDFAEAEKTFKRALEINPHYAEAHNNLGAIYEQQSKLDDAASQFREAIRDQPNYPLARFHLGRILVNQENYAEAIQHLSRALDPPTQETPLYTYALGAAYARSGDRPHALEYLQKAHDLAEQYGQTELQNRVDQDLEAIRRGR